MGDDAYLSGDSGDLLTPKLKVAAAALLSVPGCGPLLAEFGRSVLKGSPMLHDSRWVIVENAFYLGALLAPITSPLALMLLVRNGRSVGKAPRRGVWLLVLMALLAPLYFFAAACGVGL
jgi:hypothetical protein